MKQELAVITGANGGLGLAMTRRFLKAGVRVVMACRREAAAHEGLEALRREGVDVSGARVVKLDLASLTQLRAQAQALAKELSRVDYLVLNAGVFRLPPQLNEEGLERHFAINYLGHFVLTAMLWPALVQAPAARVVGVTSSTDQMAPSGILDPHQLEGHGPWISYAFSKRCLLGFLLELDRRAQAAGLSCRALAADPGFVSTSLLSSGGDARGLWGRLKNQVMRVGGSMLGQDPEQGSRTLWHACTASLASSTGLTIPKGPLGLWGAPKWAKAVPEARAPDFVDALWTLSERYQPFSI